MTTRPEAVEARDGGGRGAAARNVLSPFSHFALHVSFSGSSPRWIATLPAIESGGAVNNPASVVGS